MMAIDNPDLSLKNLNDLQNKITSNTATVNDYQELDFLISSIGGSVNYIKNTLIKNGINDFNQYLLQKSENSEGNKVRLGIIYGTILGAIDFLKSYAIKNKFYI